MRINSDFRGRVLQLVESLDFGDAVSNQVVALDSMLNELGLDTEIYSQWAHPNVDSLRKPLDDLNVFDEDIVILHFAGFSQYAFPVAQRLRCTKICVYHNITPQEFFEPGTALHDLCSKGRLQLKDVVRDCHWFWGDSQYNLEELIELGSPRSNCVVIPIVVDARPSTKVSLSSREKGAWIFLGRVAASKGQLNLVRTFARARLANPSNSQKLFLVGGYDESNPYVIAIKNEISSLGIADHVVLTGKIPDAEVENYLRRASVYVSMSEHEGFGVPLVEASHHGLPVIALRNSAVPETLGNSGVLVETAGEILLSIDGFEDPQRVDDVVRLQQENAKRFSRKAVFCQLDAALMRVLPAKHQFASVSIIICTLNRCDFLARCLDYLQYQTNQSFEVVVVNGPSSDDTDVVLGNYGSRIKVAKNLTRNLAVSRNIGIELAAGDLIAFIDDDALPFDDWVDTLIVEFSSRPLTHAAVGGPAYFGGTLEFQAQDIGVNKFAEDRQNIEPHEIGVDGWERSMLGTNACYRADVIRKMRGFDEQFDYFLDESELSFRLQKNKYIVGYCPDLFLRHEFAKSDNRSGNYRYNWYSICKNTAYFIAAYSGLESEELNRYVDRRISKERILPLDHAVTAGLISETEHESFIRQIHAGVQQGLMDAKQSFPRTRELLRKSAVFAVFTVGPRYPSVGRDIRRLHICVVTKEFPPFVPGGGIGTLYYHLVSELLLMGHWITVVVPGEFPDQRTVGRLRVCYQPISRPFSDYKGASGFENNLNWSASALHAVSQVHAYREIDVIDSALWDSESLALSLVPTQARPPLVLRLVTPFRVASRINGWSMSARERGLYETAERKLIEHADAVVPISESIAVTIESEYGLERDKRWQVSHCGIAYWPSFNVRTNYSELTMINNEVFPPSPSAKIILFIGRLERRKGVDLLVSAAPQILSSNADAILIFAGKDAENWKQSLIGSLPEEYRPRVMFLGEVDDPTRDKLLNIAYCLVFPSRYESFGLVPLEAFVHGVPVVATRAGAIPEVVEDNVSGILFDAENANALADAVVRILGSKKCREQLSVGAKNRIRQFSARRSAIVAVGLYSRLAKTGGLLGKQSIAAASRRGMRSSSFAGSHQRIQTEVGERVGPCMKTTGREGYLVYGPYLELPPGEYNLEILGVTSVSGKPAAFAEIVIESGSRKLNTQSLKGAAENSTLASLQFALASKAEVEARIWVAADAVIEVRALVFSSSEVSRNN